MPVGKPYLDSLMALYGYARTSTAAQNLESQLVALKSYGCDVIRSEKVSAGSRKGRDELQTILDFIGEGDTLVVTRIDRLARSMKDLQDIVHHLRAKGAELAATEQPIDTSDAAGKAFFDMLGVFAEFETNLRRERQAEGIAAAKARGVYTGRRPSVDREAVIEALKRGERPSHIAQDLKVSRSTVYQIKKELGVL